MMNNRSRGNWTLIESETHVRILNEHEDCVFHDDKRIPGVMDDARLVAASPLLLEACKELLNALPSATTHPAIAKARFAIKKAEEE